MDDSSTESDSDVQPSSTAVVSGAAPLLRPGRRPPRLPTPSPPLPKPPAVDSETESDDDDVPRSYFCKALQPMLSSLTVAASNGSEDDELPLSHFRKPAPPALTSLTAAAVSEGDGRKRGVLSVCEVTVVMEEEEELQSSSSLSTSSLSPLPSSPVAESFDDAPEAKAFLIDADGSLPLTLHTAVSGVVTKLS